MQKLHELAQSQLFELRAQSDEEKATKQSELGLLMDEVERAQTRLLTLEREKGHLRSQLQTANEDTENKNSDNVDSNSMLENSLTAKEKIISELNMEIHNVETALANEREDHVTEIKKLNSLLNKKDTIIEEMKKELQERPSAKLVDDLRKKVKFCSEPAQVQLSEKTSLLEKAEAKGEELTATVNEQQRLIQKLEDDILKVCYSSKERKGALFNEWEFSEAGGAEQSEAPMDQKHAPTDQDQSSMLKVICSQRDRFRARLRETEEEIRRLKEKIGCLTDELEKTKADNVKLYGKIRYVQDYNHDKVVSRGSKKYVEDLESGFSSDVESKYKKIYEDDINPFAAFSKKRSDYTKQWPLPSRKQGSISYARTFAFFYTIGLHVLVFTCLYRMSALSYLSHGAEETPVTETTTNLPRGF
ncbi:unnamed protein product [Eruca vesicaria subsp. sativa]|uniref:CASP C-terminal domain-containing protein n=1 Tax=Eruca vesicaria subsp. sativa TaxID=29727 RepID=A0ABC8IUW1_ERUVS|nr:unnamed protein product [Eruca vesicaria subsp. sativa]